MGVEWDEPSRNPASSRKTGRFLGIIFSGLRVLGLVVADHASHQPIITEF